MKIDEIIEELEDSKDYPTSDPPSDEALDGAIDIIRKYQKIEKIVENRGGKSSLATLVRIIRVVEDGNNTTNAGSN